MGGLECKLGILVRMHEVEGGSVWVVRVFPREDVVCSCRVCCLLLFLMLRFELFVVCLCWCLI